jgi:type I restriction-modification system DNA methylase subunit
LHIIINGNIEGNTEEKNSLLPSSVEFKHSLGKNIKQAMRMEAINEIIILPCNFFNKIKISTNIDVNKNRINICILCPPSF